MNRYPLAFLICVVLLTLFLMGSAQVPAVRAQTLDLSPFPPIQQTSSLPISQETSLAKVQRRDAPQSTYLCGQLVQSDGGYYQWFLPCSGNPSLMILGYSQPSTPPGLVDGAYYRVTDPQIVQSGQMCHPTYGCTTTYILITVDANPYANWQLINSCSVSCSGVPAPSANFDAYPGSGTAPLTVSMHIVSTANITSCTWDYGDGQTGTSCADYHNHVYTAAGTYTVKLTVSGPGGSDAQTRNNYITVTTPSVNHPPVANNQNVTPAQNTPVSITLSASDADNDPLTYSVVSNPSHGTLSGTAPNFTYTPNTSFSGADNFTFKANDGKADSNIATVSITVTSPTLSSISGRVVDSSNSPLSGITIYANGPTTQAKSVPATTESKSATTDSGGNYTFTGLQPGYYILTPIRGGYTFAPTARAGTVPPSAPNANFTGTFLQLDIAVTDVQIPASPICAGSAGDFYAYISYNSSVASGFFDIQWQIDGQPADTTQTNFMMPGTGEYKHTFQSIPLGQHTFTVVADATNLVTETNEGNNQGSKTFTAIDCSLSSISGQVKDANNNLISGVTISDGVGHTAPTDANGNYTFSGLATGTYTLTPTKSGYTFSPTSRTITVPPNATAVNFTGAAPTGNIITILVIQGSDDAGIDNACSYFTISHEIYFGQCNNGTLITSGFRFQNVQIPAGATINEAHLEFTVDGPYTSALTVTFFGQRSENSATFTNTDGPDNRPLTTASVPWTISDPWSFGQSRSSPNLASIIQEIVNLPSWVNGNALTIITKSDSAVPSNTARRVYGWEREKNSTHTAHLVVSYKEQPQPTCYTLTTSVIPSGGGTVASAPSPNCQGNQYTQGTVVSLSATANAGYGFSSWSGAVSGNANPVAVTMDGNKNVTANFNLILTYSISGRITDANNNPISGVTISDGAGHSVTNDASGNYTLSGLAPGTYTLTPSKSGYTFSPASLSVTIPSDGTQNFTGTTQQTNNLIPNSSFEDPDPNNPNKPAFWSSSCGGGGWDNSVFHTGTHSVQTCGNWYITVTVPDPPPNYTLFVWHKDSGNCVGVPVQYEGFDEDGNPTGDVAPYLNCSSEWAQGIIPINISQARSIVGKLTRTLRISLLPGTIVVTTWWDDIELLPIVAESKMDISVAVPDQPVEINGDKVLQIRVVSNGAPVQNAYVVRRENNSGQFLDLTDSNGYLNITYDQATSPQAGSFSPIFVATANGTEASVAFPYSVSLYDQEPVQTLGADESFWLQLTLLLKTQLPQITDPTQYIPVEWLKNRITALMLFFDTLESFLSYRSQAGDVFRTAIYKYQATAPNVPVIYRYIIQIERSGQIVYSGSLFSSDVEKLPKLKQEVAMVHLASPANLYLTDPQGRHTGIDPITGANVKEIPDSYYLGPNTEPQVLMVLNPSFEAYTVIATGTGTGTIHLDVGGLSSSGSATRDSIIAPISTGQQITKQFYNGHKLYLPMIQNRK